MPDYMIVWNTSNNKVPHMQNNYLVKFHTTWKTSSQLACLGENILRDKTINNCTLIHAHVCETLHDNCMLTRSSLHLRMCPTLSLLLADGAEHMWMNQDDTEILSDLISHLQRVNLCQNRLWQAINDKHVIKGKTRTPLQ